MSTDWDTLQEHCDSNNRMVNIFNDDIPFRVEEIEPNTKKITNNVLIRGINKKLNNIALAKFLNAKRNRL